jgi:hypothetical protein
MSNGSILVEGKRPPALQPSGQAAPACEVDISCYDSVPPSLEAELERLYHHLNSSLRHHAVARRARDACAYVARRGEQPLAIFLFRHEGRSIEVFNEMMQIPPEEIERFATYIFSRFPSVVRVAFSKIGKDIGTLSLPWQQYGHAEDIVVRLPETVDAYLARLGAKTRYNIRRQMKVIAADFPGCSFATYENGAIAEKHVADLVELKKANMNEKRIKFGITPEEASWMTELAKTRGLLVLALLDGKVCGGSLSFRLGDHYFAHLNGYDTRFAKYSLGMLCCYLAMTEKIQRGTKEAHLLWGRNPYKFKLLGVARDVANLDIYRSRLRYCRYGKRVLRNALHNLVHQQKRMLLENEQQRGLLPSLLGRVVKIMRRVKRSNFRPAS